MGQLLMGTRFGAEGGDIATNDTSVFGWRSAVLASGSALPDAVTETVRTAMREIDPTAPIQEFASQSEQISQRFAQERLFARAYAAFGALAVLLAAIGLFGLMSYNVARRTSEIGVRLALGAQRRAVIGMVMSESIRLVAIGIVLGFAAVLWAGRFVQTVVYGLSPIHPLTIGGAVA